MKDVFRDRDGPRTVDWTDCSLIKSMILSAFSTFSPEQAEKISKVNFPKVVARVESSDWYQEGKHIMAEDVNSVLADILCGN